MTVTANALASRLRAIRRTAANFMSFEIDYECIDMVAVLFYGDVFLNHSLHCIVLALQPGKCEGEDDEANENERRARLHPQQRLHATCHAPGVISLGLI